ncbi:trp operon repressor [Endozoicomonas sp. SCSIO W0465]|uniref:trp operon repressor n=1 Tax=Endozoicomonas sp. SCSIO W0465 TaxID=2918516 RepID=UPI002074AC8C|nr:trp operon repressor [Endozoicomonas sp. SCSIO W0465]USE35139.1 trp operon repressor [Endozoicomonas sp. SCSIO W0465]
MKTESWFQVIKLLKGQQDLEALYEVMRVLLTQEERDAIGSRLAIMRALLSGEESQREIAARIGVSIAKVTRGSNYLKRLSATEIAMIEQI